MLARIYDDADAVVMTPAYAAPLGLTPKSDALLTDSVENDETQVGCAARRFFYECSSFICEFLILLANFNPLFAFIHI